MESNMRKTVLILVLLFGVSSVSFAMGSAPSAQAGNAQVEETQFIPRPAPTSKISRPLTEKQLAAKKLPSPKAAVELPSFSTYRVKRMFGGTEAQKARGLLRSFSCLASDLNFFYGSSLFHDFARADLLPVPAGATEPVAHEINGRIVDVCGSMADLIDIMDPIAPFLNDAFPMSTTSPYPTFTDWLRTTKQWAINRAEFHTALASYVSFGTYGIPESDPRARIQAGWEAYLENLRTNGRPRPVDDSGNTLTRWSDYCDLISRNQEQIRDIFAEKSVEIGGMDPRPVGPPVGTRF